MEMNNQDSRLSTPMTVAATVANETDYKMPTSIVPSMPTLSSLYAPENAPDHLDELDDDLHTITYEPDGHGGERPILDDVESNKLRTWTNARALINGGAALVLILAIVMLFAGYPIFSRYYPSNHHTSNGNRPGVNGSGQTGTFAGARMGLIDPDTPQDAYTRLAIDGTTMMNLVFSDEFEMPGRSFYPGDEYVQSSHSHSLSLFYLFLPLIAELEWDRG